MNDLFRVSPHSLLESMAVGLSVPLGWDGATGPASTAAYVAPPPDGPCCRLPTATCSPVTDEFAGWGADPAPGAGRLLPGSIESPKLASSLVFHLPASCWEALVPLPDVVLRLPAGTAGFFFLLAIASLNSLRRARKTCKVEITFIKVNSSCFSMILRQGHSEKSSCPSSVWLRWGLGAETSSFDSLFDQLS